MPPEQRKQRRGDLSDAQWKLIEPLLPKQKRGGKWNDHRLMFDGILWCPFRQPHLHSAAVTGHHPAIAPKEHGDGEAATAGFGA